MKPSDEEIRNGLQAPYGGPTGEDESAPNVGATTATDESQTSTDLNDGESQIDNQGFLSLSVVSEIDKNKKQEEGSKDDSGLEPFPEFNQSSPEFNQDRSGPSRKTADDVSSWAESVVSEMKPEDVDDDSPSRLEWLRQKREDNEENPFLDQLMSMVGLEKVKAHFLAVKARVKARVEASKSTGAEQIKLRLHLVLQGKDGTGAVENQTTARNPSPYSIRAAEDQTLAQYPSMPDLWSTYLGKQTTAPYPSQGYPSQGYPSQGYPGPPKDPAVGCKYSNAPFITNAWQIVFHDKSNSSNAGLIHPENACSFPCCDYPPRPGCINSPNEMDSLMETAEKSVLILSSRQKSLLDSIESSETALQEFPTPLTLSDYNDDELSRLLVRIMQKRGLSVEGGNQDRNLRALVRRVARERESESFSNVHNLQKELDNACRRRALRLQREYAQWFGVSSTGKSHSSQLLSHTGQQQIKSETDKTPRIADVIDDRKNVLTPEDLLGPEPKDIRHHNASWKRLQDMIGLERIKSECGDMIDYAQINHQREILGIEPLKIGLNRLFLGPPGVGKTTVAQLYGQILIDLGLVSGKKIMLRNPTHLIGEYVGESEEKTMEVLERARGNVLIIDDAHMLYPGASGSSHKTDVFRVAVLDTIVANVSADPEDRCIILAGYEHEMGQLFNNSNPGLQRRFPKETALRFETYSEDDLCRIMDLKASQCDLEMTEEARAVSRQVLGRMRINPKFGNAGDVENLLNQAKVRLNARIRSAYHGLGSVQVALEPGDIDPQWDRASRAGQNRQSLFEDFVGFDKIVKQFEGYQHLVDGMRLHGINPKPHIPWAFIFKGPPGTGKTSTARKVGRLYYDMGLLSTDEVVTCSVTDLVGEGMGETGPKVINTLETGLGKVLFVDEAYRLAGGTPFHKEAIDEIVDAMTQPRYHDNMVVILAGYTKEMEFLLRTNPGLRGRFPEQVVFEPMTPHACLEHLISEVQKLKINIQDAKGPGGEKIEMVYRLFERLSRTKGWASGRDVETLAKIVIGKVFMKEGKARREGVMDSLCITTDELIEVLQDMRKERKGH